MEDLNNKISKSDVMGTYRRLSIQQLEKAYMELLLELTFYTIKQLLKRVKELLLNR